MKKFAVISSALAAVVLVSALSVSAYAESDPADDTASYSYVAGEQAYTERMAEEHPWFDNEEDEEASADYSFHGGRANAQARKNAFAGMPTEDDLSDEELDAFFSANGIGSGAAYEDGVYNEAAKSAYGFQAGQAAYQQRHAAFANG